MVKTLRSALALPSLSRLPQRIGVPRWIAEPQWTRSPLAPLIDPHGIDTLRVLTLNIAHGRGIATHQALLGRRQLVDNLSRIGDLIGEQAPDVVALQEADGPSTWSGNFHHVEVLARRIEHNHTFLGEHNPFGLGAANLVSGTALISRDELLAPESHRFGSSWRDTKGFVVATVEVPGWSFEVDVVSTHFEALHPAIRRRQIRLLAHHLSHRTRPLIVVGDLNASWCRESRQFRPLIRRLGLRSHQPYHKAPTFPAVRPWRRLDWVLLSRELEFSGYQTLDTVVSDHLAVVADIRPARIPIVAEPAVSTPDAPRILSP